MHRLAQSVLEYIRKRDLLRPGSRVAIAVSGGADSVALLRLMLDLRQELGVVVSVVHLNHKLRGAESDADEKFVGDLASSFGLDVVCAQRDVKVHAEAEKQSLETAARRLRYQFFEELLCEGRLDRVATAHTLNDQAETVLLKMARGAGTRGSAGIYPKRVVNESSNRHSGSGNQSDESISGNLSTRPAIIRPLLPVRRDALREYLNELNQLWREDSSNRDLRHTRNRIRHGILPRFERHVNPKVCQILADAAEIARGEEEYWQQEIRRLMHEAWNAENAALNPGLLERFPIAVQRRLVRAAAESLGINLEFCHVQEILGLEREGQSSALPRGWLAILERGELRFRAEAETSAADYEYKLCVPGTVAVPEAGTAIESRLASVSSLSEQLLDSALAERPLILRNWRAGERFWPAHTKEPRKIKELLQDRHITGDEKRRWPVIACSDEIVWMKGFGIRRDCQAKGAQGVLIREVSLTD